MYQPKQFSSPFPMLSFSPTPLLPPEPLLHASSSQLPCFQCALHSDPPNPLGEAMDGAGGWSLAVMVSFYPSLLLTHFPPLLPASHHPSAHPGASVPLGTALSQCGLPMAAVPQECLSTDTGHTWATVPSEALLLCHRAPLSKSASPAVSAASVPFHTPPPVCPHITPQVSPHVSPASGSFHPFLNISEDHELL